MLQAVVLRNVRSFKSAIHAEENATAFTSLRIPIKVILTTSQEIRREVFHAIDSCLTVSGDTERGLARVLRSETKRGYKENENEKTD